MEPVQMKPTLYVTSKDLPEIKKWSVGDTYEVIVRMKMVGLHDNGNSNMSASFEVNSFFYPDAEETIDDVASTSNHRDFEKKSAALKRKYFS